MAKQIIFRSLLLWYIILMISMANSVFCDNTPNDVTSTAESKDNLDISKMIKKYFEGSIDESEFISFIKNNKDNFALNEKFEFSDKELVKGLRGLEKKALECIELSLWCFKEPECSLNDEESECIECSDKAWLDCLRISKTCQNQIDEEKLKCKGREECIGKCTSVHHLIGITSKGIISYSEYFGIFKFFYILFYVETKVPHIISFYLIGDLSVVASTGIIIGAIVVLAVGA